MSEPRYIVSSVTGVEIRPGRGGQSSSYRIPTSYYVLDRAYCHREAARFDAGKVAGGDVRRLLLAEAKCAELNAWDEAEHGA